MYFYQIFADDHFHEEIGNYHSYGIRVFRQSTAILSIPDISTDRGGVLDLVRKCNELGLDPAHLADVVEDYLAEV